MSIKQLMFGILGGAAIITGVTAALAAQELCQFAWGSTNKTCDNAPAGGLAGKSGSGTSVGNTHTVKIDYQNTVGGGFCSNVPLVSGVELNPASCKVTDVDPLVTVPTPSKSCVSLQVPTAFRMFCNQ
jgi:hypothetical protein